MKIITITSRAKCHTRVTTIVIIKTIYIRKQARLSHGKKTTATDERYLKLAEDHLYSEFSMLLDIPKEHMADYIEQRVHQQKEAEEQVCAV